MIPIRISWKHLSFLEMHCRWEALPLQVGAIIYWAGSRRTLIRAWLKS